MRATVQLSLGDPETALPLNDPPPVPYTFLPRSSIVQVTKEEEHFAALLRFVPPGTPEFPAITPHDLRHTCASLAISAGANVKVLQRLLGHKTATLTLDRYGHLFPR